MDWIKIVKKKTVNKLILVTNKNTNKTKKITKQNKLNE